MMKRLLLLLLVCQATAAPSLDDADEHELILPTSSRTGWQVDTSLRNAVHLFYQAHFRPIDIDSNWDGSLEDCRAGQVSGSFRLLTLQRINAYRALAGIPADLELDPAASRKTQAAALSMAAAQKITHQLDESWPCFSSEAKEGAANSALGLGSNGQAGIDEFMRDGGPHNGGVHHRRWLLYPQTRFIGLGEVVGPSPLQRAHGFSAFDGLYGSNRPSTRHPFVAWPPPGYLPYPLAFTRWSFSLPGADFSQAKVSMQYQQQMLSINQEIADLDAGEPTLVWQLATQDDLQPWPKPDADHRYQVQIEHVRVHGQLQHYRYEVTLFDPAAGIAPSSRVSGPAKIGLTGDFRISPLPGATGYQWRALGLQAITQLQPQLRYQGSGGAPRQTNGTIRLAHEHEGDEILQLETSLVAGPHAKLLLKQRLGVAGIDETVRVELRQQGQADWQLLHSQTGGGSVGAAERDWRTLQLDLSRHADRPFELRLRYALPGGSFYSPDDHRVGWFIAEAQLEDCWQIIDYGPASRSRNGGFRFQPEQAGDYALQARPTVYRAPADWGPLWRVQVRR